MSTEVDDEEPERQTRVQIEGMEVTTEQPRDQQEMEDNSMASSAGLTTNSTRARLKESEERNRQILEENRHLQEMLQNQDSDDNSEKTNKTTQSTKERYEALAKASDAQAEELEAKERELQELRRMLAATTAPPSQANSAMASNDDQARSCSVTPPPNPYLTPQHHAAATQRQTDTQAESVGREG